MYKRFLVTGGAGFIGSAFIRYALKTKSSDFVLNLDLMTYAADRNYLKTVENDDRYFFVQGNICDERLIETLCVEHRIEAIVHFAAETHVDRSISGPSQFFETNVRGTYALLEIIRKHPKIHYHHVSTDEVYGSLGAEGFFSEKSPYLPNSPYAASKAASDHFVRAYSHTYGISTTMSHCSNNFGPCQHDEKFLPTLIRSCILKQPIPIYGNGRNVRDWLFVDDHIEALWLILQEGKSGEVYDIGGGEEKRNIDLAFAVIDYFEQIDKGDYRRLISYVADRAGHDYRYAIDASKIKKELGWAPRTPFDQALKQTINWYCEKYENCLRHSCTP